MNKLLVFLTAFLCGMSVMGVEMAATRLLAPYFGASQIVWTIVIGIIMISLSWGYFRGGKTADKFNNPDKLFITIWKAAVWITLIPLLGKYLASVIFMGLMAIAPSGLIIAGASLSCLIIFSFPLIKLGMVSPYLVKLALDHQDNDGEIVGKIYALSTIGSLIGTLIPTFVTIPTIGTQKTFLFFAVVLHILCLYYYVGRKVRLKRTVATGILTLAFLIMPFGSNLAFWKEVKAEYESNYNYLIVSENSDVTTLSTNVGFGFQSASKKNSLFTGYYYDYASMAPFFLKDVNRLERFKVLVLGHGTGTFTKQVKQIFPKSEIQGVEIDKKINFIAKKYFGLNENMAKIHISDGRVFVKTSKEKYDIIFIDAYHDISTPFHMATKEFYEEVKSCLTKNGIIVMNICLGSTNEKSVSQYLQHTLRSCMNKVYSYQTSDNNLILIAMNNYSLKAFNENIKDMSQSHQCKKIIDEIKSKVTEVNDQKYVLTDDLSNIELLEQKSFSDVINKAAAENPLKINLKLKINRE
jgi:spermidine synthase